jgi:copper transport protein
VNRGLLRGLVVVAVALLAALVGAGTASAHAELDSTNPVDGTTLPASPPRLELRFTLPVQVAATHVTVSGGGQTYAVGGPDAASTATVVSVPLPPLPRGAYRITWSTISADDLHRTSGALTVGVQEAVTPAGVEPGSDAAPDGAESIARWAGFAGLAGLLGAAAVGAMLGAVPAGPGRDTAARRLAALAVAGAALALAGDVALLVAQAVEAAGDGGSVGEALGLLLTAPPRAVRWWTREAALAALFACAVAGAVLGRRRGRAPRIPLASGVAAALAVAATGAVLGHSAGSGPLRVAIDATHQLTSLLWAGGLAAVALVLVRMPRDAAARTLLRRFSLLATGCVAVLTVTGLLLTGTAVASLDALLLSHFGWALLVKTGLLAVALVFALVNTLGVHRSGGRLPRRALVAEAAVVLAALGAAAVLGASPHATGTSWAVAEAAVPQLSGQADDLVESVAATPNLPGQPNEVAVHVLQTRRPAPAPVAMVTVRMAGPGGAVVEGTARPTDPGTYVLDTTGLVTGAWDVSVRVTRPGLPDALAGYRWVVTDPSRPGHAVVWSGAPIDAPLGAGAAAVAVIALVAGGVVGWRRRRPAPAPAVPERVGVGAALHEAQEAPVLAGPGGH